MTRLACHVCEGSGTMDVCEPGSMADAGQVSRQIRCDSCGGDGVSRCEGTFPSAPCGGPRTACDAVATVDLDGVYLCASCAAAANDAADDDRWPPSRFTVMP